jgi:hypothetical protein
MIKALDGNTAYATVYVSTASNSKGVYITTDGGKTWTKQNAYTSSLMGPGYIHFFDANNGVVIGDPNLETYTTTNGGLNWNPVSMPPSLAGEYTKLSDAGIASSGNHVWFSTGAHIFRSTDRGYTWSASPSEPLYKSWYPCIAFQDSNTGIYSLKLAPGGIDHFYRKTTDGGVTWSTLSDSIIDGIAPTCIQYLPGSGATYLVAGGMPQGMRGFACTFNAGKDWRLIDTSGHLCIAFPSATVGWGGGLAYVSNDVYKYVALPLSVEIENTVPASYLLAQNYPNPFNPSTTIKYELPTSTMVKLSVYDLLGREVSVLVNARMDAGVHEVRFDGSKLASGVYFYRLHAGGFVQSKRILLLR